jgi:hypothetical protein
MFVLNGLLLISLVFALRRVFDARVALGALLFLVIDPTVAAHWPVVMTDLPVVLLSQLQSFWRHGPSATGYGRTLQYVLCFSDWP